MNLRRQRKQSQLVNVTPLIDVVFILLIFFMLTTNFGGFRLIGVDTPEETEIVRDPAAAIVLLVKSDGGLDFDGSPSSPEVIHGSLLSILAVDPLRPILIRPEPEVSMQAALDAFELTRRAGAYAVSFSGPAEVQ
jgi:biopolymer transport protein ExbD